MPLNPPFCPASELCADALRAPRADRCKDAPSLLRVLTIPMSGVRSSCIDHKKICNVEQGATIIAGSPEVKLSDQAALAYTVQVHRSSAHPMKCDKAE